MTDYKRTDVAKRFRLNQTMVWPGEGVGCGCLVPAINVYPEGCLIDIFHDDNDGFDEDHIGVDGEIQVSPFSDVEADIAEAIESGILEEIAIN